MLTFIVTYQGDPNPEAALSAQLREQVREQVRQQVEQAREQARLAREQAQLAREQARVGADAARATTEMQMPPAPWVMQHNDIPPGVRDIAFAFFWMIAAIVILGPIVRAWARRMDRRTQMPAAVTPEIAQQLQRIEQAVDTMAIEIERISEAQRFSAKLLAERQPESAMPVGKAQVS